MGAVLRGRVRHLDLGGVSTGSEGPWPTTFEHLFMLMLSLGPDAGVVHRLAATRRGPITHASYLRPALHEALEPTLPSVTLACDGKVVAQGRGMVIIANSRHYGGRLNPCHDAQVDDGLLDAAFLPADNAAELARWLLAARLRLHHHSEHLTQVRGRRFEIRCAEPAPVQVDGEAWPHASRVLRLSVLPGVLRAIMPMSGA
jgi:diacylglycerol kinase family enzyme